MNLDEDGDGDSNTDNEEFYFESDHLALRGNSDYSAVLRTLVVLEAQRIQATKDLESLVYSRKAALEDPLKFVKKLSHNEVEVPGSIIIAEIPRINFEKYNVKFPEPNFLTNQSTTKSADFIFEREKGDTFNQPWTTEEQRRLESLLIEYPVEQYEMRRFAKISRALGNRTTKQVASRVQKYFKKLYEAGLPIPGRIPKAVRHISKASKYNKNTFKPSTFFPSYDVPVTMPEDDDIRECIYDPLSTNMSVKSFDKESGSNHSNEYAVDSESDDSIDNSTEIDELSKNELKLLKLLNRIKTDKKKDTPDRIDSIHYGYKCNYCSEEPMIGTRWHCKTCRDDSIDFCSDCLIMQLMSEHPHSVQHQFSGIRVRNEEKADTVSNTNFNENSDSDDDHVNIHEDHYDKDYLMSKFSKDQEYNYLDPNFIL